MTYPKFIRYILLALAVPALGCAQMLINDFSATETNGSLINWSGQQNAGNYDFIGSDDDASGIEFAQVLDLSGYDSIDFTARLDAVNNTAASFVVAFFNDNAEFATATFLTSAFSSASFTTVNSVLTFSGGFDPSAVTFYRISGGVFPGGDQLAFTADTLSAIAAIPEPSTYAAIFGGLALVGAVVYRRRQAKAALAVA